MSSSENEEDEEMMTSDEEEGDENEEVYEGQTNEHGEPDGRGTVYFDQSGKNKFQGHFKNGQKEGRGCFYLGDGSTLEGRFEGDGLQGEGIYTHEDGSYTISEYKDGEMNGHAKEYDHNKKLVFEGNYQENERIGLCHFYDEFQGHLFGCVDKNGKLTGKNIMYAYPDEETFLKGTFKDGEMVDAQLAFYNGIGDKFNPHSYNKVKDSFHFNKDVSTNTSISKNPLQTDPYEQKRVFVKKSIILDAGEGLFSSIDASEGEVMSFYNGIRLTHQIVDDRDWSFNDNTISLNQETVIDVPKELSSTNSYCASLGHKANHSFRPNCKYDRFHHPRFGSIKCIRTIQRVKTGDELTVAYGYDHTKLDTDAPEWYKLQLKRFLCNNSNACT